MSLDITGNYRYPPPDEEWLGRSVEAALEPSLPIIDPHHHLWEQHQPPYFLDALKADVQSGHAVVATVCVESHFRYRQYGPAHLRPVGETEAVMALIAANEGSPRLCAGIVAHADLTLGAGVDEVIEAHRVVAGERLKGIRHSVSRDEHFPNGIVIRPAPRGLLADARYRDGLKRLASCGLSYDAMLYHAQIPELTDTAAAISDLPIVLDHFGCILGVGPYEALKAESFDSWRRNLRDLAQRENVSIKLGGMGMIVCGARYHEYPAPPGSVALAADFAPYVETAIEAFGPSRCMFESNFPVDKAMYSYRTLWNAFKRLTARHTARERAYLFHDTAKAFYRL
ncbi:MAG: amidohydrolase [Parvularculaceae bacterium]